MKTFPPVQLDGGPKVFAANVVARYREVKDLCRDEDEGPSDLMYYTRSVDLLTDEQQICRLHYPRRYPEISKPSYSVDHFPKDHGPGLEIREEFEHVRDKGLTYSREELRDGLLVSRSKWKILPNGKLVTKHAEFRTEVQALDPSWDDQFLVYDVGEKRHFYNDE